MGRGRHLHASEKDDMSLPQVPHSPAQAAGSPKLTCRAYLPRPEPAATRSWELEETGKDTTCPSAMPPTRVLAQSSDAIHLREPQLCRGSGQQCGVWKSGTGLAPQALGACWATPLPTVQLLTQV